MPYYDYYEEDEDIEDPLLVYCRIRPFKQSKPSFIKLISDTSVQLTLQDEDISGKQYTFKNIFTENSTSKEIFNEVALPLVEQLINDANGVLFTCGVAGSGKTITTTDSEPNFGLMPRCLDVLFNSIANYQADKFIFKSDGFNRFKMQSEPEAAYDRDINMLCKNMAFKSLINNSQKDGFGERRKDETKIEVKEKDNVYAVFISYFMVFRNQFCDLLDKRPKMKKVNDDADAYGNTYVHGGIEVEVKNTNEAIEAFRDAEKRKLSYQNTLKIDSSYSHFVFTIKLVQAPRITYLKPNEKDKNIICVSQLSLVDLAKCRRSTSQTLIEAEQENQSLMLHIRKCMETMCERQRFGVPKEVSYAEHSITYLFRNLFQRGYYIRMICGAGLEYADAYENAFVMQFAEEIENIKRNSKLLTSTQHSESTPGQRKPRDKFRKAVDVLDKLVKKSDHKSHPNVADDSACPQKGLFHSDRDYEALELKLKQQESKVQQLESQLQEKESQLQKKESKLQKLKSLLDDSDEDAINVRQHDRAPRLVMTDKGLITVVNQESSDDSSSWSDSTCTDFSSFN